MQLRFLAIALLLGGCPKGSTEVDSDTDGHTEVEPDTDTDSDSDSDSDPDTYGDLTDGRLQSCTPDTTTNSGHYEQVTCATVVGEIQFDQYTVAVSGGDCVYVLADNVGPISSTADLVAYAFDELNQFYGLASDYSELDDEHACTNVPWNEFACPAAGFMAEVDGNLTIGVGQWGGDDNASCTNDSPYTVYISVNGVPVDLSAGPSADDVPLGL